MILIYAIIFLIILALLFGRDLAAIGRLHYRGGWKLGLIVGAIFFLQAAFVLYAPGQTLWQMLLIMTSHLALICLFLLNRHVAGARLFVLGLILNTTVMAANGGWMPITPETYQAIRPNRVVELQSRAPASKGIMLTRAETRLWVLSDVIPVHLPWHKNAMSLGDLFLILGVAWFLFRAAPNRRYGQLEAGVGRQSVISIAHNSP
jgi:hypothetical protein